MRQKLLVGLLSAGALVCVVFCFLHTSLTGVFTAAMAFPFEQIGLGLRALSLSGGAGNVAAIIIYIAICISPLAYLLFWRRKRGFRAEDGLICLLCVVLFAVLYIMINPGVISSMTGGAVGQSVGKAALGLMVYSILCGYAIFRALRLFSESTTDRMMSYLSIMLCLLSALFVYLVFGVGFSGLLGSITALRAGNIGNEHLLGTSYIFLVMKFIIDALPYAFNVVIVLLALRLLDEMRADRYSDETIIVAGRISRTCVIALVATVLASIGFNLLQFLFAGSLMVINSSMQLPLFSIAFVFAVLLLTRLVAEGKKLKDYNDLII